MMCLDGLLLDFEGFVNVFLILFDLFIQCMFMVFLLAIYLEYLTSLHLDLSELLASAQQHDA